MVYYEFKRIVVVAPAVIPVHFALTYTKFPVKLYYAMVVLKSVVSVVLAISNQSSSVGVAANVPCILMAPVIVVFTLYATVCTPSVCE